MRNAFLFLLLATAMPVNAGPQHDHSHHQHHHQHAHDYAFGEPGRAADVKRTIHVELTDGMRFVTKTPLQIRRGETVRFVVRNSGRLPHEFSLGDVAFQKQHAAEMKQQPHMEHSDPNTVTVAPGKTAELIWKFSRVPGKGELQIACHVPGHYEAGMHLNFKVQP